MQTTFRTQRQKSCFPSCIHLQQLPWTPYSESTGTRNRILVWPHRSPVTFHEKKVIPRLYHVCGIVLRIEHGWWEGKQFITNNILCRMRSYLWYYFRQFASSNIGHVYCFVFFFDPAGPLRWDHSSFRLASLCITDSRSIHVTANDSVSLVSMAE